MRLQAPRFARRVGNAVSLCWRETKLALSVLALISIAAALAPLASVWLTKRLVDQVVARMTVEPLITTAVLLSAAVTATALLPAISRVLSTEVSRRSSAVAQRTLFEAAGGIVGIGPFESPEVQNKFRAAQQFGCEAPGQLTTVVLSLTQSLVTVAGCWLALATLHPALPAVVLVAVIPSVVLDASGARRMAQLTMGLSPIDRREIFYRDLLTSPQAAKEIRLFDAGAFLRARMRDMRARSSHERRQIDLLELRTRIVASIVTAVPSLISLVWVAIKSAHGTTTAGDVTLAIGIALAFQTSVSGILRDLGVFLRESHLFGEYQDLTRLSLELSSDSMGRDVGRLTDRIEFRDVWFRYPGAEDWTIRGITFTIHCGEKIGVVGVNGSGKSTIVKLLCRFYDPDKGSITWDGADLREFEPSALRRRIGAVFQDSMKYDLSLRENVTLSKTDPSSDAAVLDALCRAGVDDIVWQNPPGLSLMLSRLHFTDESDSTQGADLSGGQWQRVALARAYYHGARDLMILDEPNSNLDPDAEALMHARVMEYRGDKTAILVSHRLGALSDATTVVVVDKGTIAEQGSPRDLLSRSGVYSRMFAAQAAGYLAQATMKVN